MSVNKKPSRGFPPGFRAGNAAALPTSRSSALARSPGGRLKELLSRPDAARLIRSAPAQELYLLVRQVGLADCAELLELARPDQLQRMVDLDVWEGDSLRLERYLEWFSLLVDTSTERLEQLLKDLDPEPIILYLKAHTRIHIQEYLTDQERLEVEAGTIVESPDGVYWIEFPGDDEHLEFIRRLLYQVYAVDLKLGHWLLESARHELDSGLEEQAYRLRTGRIEELGYYDFFEAQQLYQPLKTVTSPMPRAAGGRPLPGPLAELPLPQSYLRPTDGSFLVRALELLLSRHPEADPSRELLRLANKVLAAGRRDPGALEEIRDALQEVRSYVGLGLELQAEGELERAVQILRRAQLEWLFRRGYGSAVELQRQARALQSRLRPAYRRLPGPLVDEPYAEVLRGLFKPRPQFFTGLEGRNPPDLVPFASRSQLRRTAEVLRALEPVFRFVFEFLAPEPVSQQVLEASLKGQGLGLTPSGVFLTSVARRLTGGTFAPLPLDEAALVAFLTVAFEPVEARGRLRPFSPAFLAQVNEGLEAFAATAEADEVEDVGAFVARSLTELREAYGALDLSERLPLKLIGGPLYLMV